MKTILLALSTFALGGFLSLHFLTDYVDSGVTPQQMTDALYTQKIINRISNEKHILKTHENWYTEKNLLTEEAENKQDRIKYALLSLWTINKENKKHNQIEKDGLQAVVNNPDKPYYKFEQQGEIHYFYAFYPEKAISPICVSCHNEHKNSPKTDLKLNDVMGAAVIRIQLDLIQLKMDNISDHIQGKIGGLRG